MDKFVDFLLLNQNRESCFSLKFNNLHVWQSLGYANPT
jgi:hypothetical protein